MVKTIAALICTLFLTNAAMAQCGPFKHHPLWPDTVGYANVDLNECNATSCLWDNGSTDIQTDLGVGPHSVIFYGMSNDTIQFQIVQDYWEFGQTVQTTFAGLELHIWPRIEPFGLPQVFNNPACTPDPSSVTVYLLQDGTAMDSIHPVDTGAGENHWWFDLPFGHTYQVHLLDNSSCGSSVMGDIVTAYTSGEVQFSAVSQDAIGGANGSIQIFGVTPDPGSPLPPPVPFTGHFNLSILPDHTPVGDEQTGSGALWENLQEGVYNVHFSPDNICNPSDTVITILGATGTSGIAADRSRSLHVWPQPAHDVLQWSTTGRGTLQVHDSRGSFVLSGKNTGNLDISDLPSGIYHMQISHGTTVERATFLKQ